MLIQRSLLPRQQSIRVRQKKAGTVSSFIHVASRTCLRHLNHVTARGAKRVALHHAAIGEQLGLLRSISSSILK